MKGENLGERTFRGWYVVAACFMFMVVSAGIGWNAFPVFIKPLEVEFGWTRTQLNGAVGVWALVTGLVSPLLGHWLDRIGERRIMTAGVIVAGLSALAMGWVHSLTQLYVIIIFSAIGTASTTYLPVASIISRWFVKRRGLAMSIAMMGMGVGGFIVPNVASVLIDQVGWRWTYHIFGITILVLLTPVGLLWLRDAPSTPENGDAPSENGNDSPNEGLSVREALRTRNFWGIGLADMLEGMALVGIMTNMVVFSIDAGISAGAAAFGFSLVMGAGTIGMLAAGPAADRFNRRVLITLSYTLPAVLVLILFRLDSVVSLFVFAILLGIMGAGKATLWPLIVNDCFGERSYATVMGFLMMFYTLGAAIGPPLAGYVFDTTGSYYRVFLFSIGAFLLSGVAMAIGSRPRAGNSKG